MSVSLFQTLPPLPIQDILAAHILEQGVNIKIEKGSFLSHYGVNINYIYYIKDGVARTFRETPNGERKILHVIGRGYFLFESYFFSRSPLQIACNALKDLYLVRFSKDKINILMLNEPSFAKSLMYSMGLKMQLMGFDLVNTAYARPDNRLKLCLASLASTMGEKSAEGINICITHYELSELVGLHRVSVSRILNKWENSKLLFLGRGNILLFYKFFNDETCEIGS